MCKKDFVHLHTHTGYSILDGMSKVEDLAEKAHSHGSPALAITDHGTMGGIISLANECQSHGIKPIPGIEFYHTEDRFAGPQKNRATGGKSNYHLTSLAVSTEGYHNLIRLSSLAQVESKHGKWGFVDDELLSQYGEGIILTSGCMGSQVYQHILNGDYDKALAQAAAHRDIVGKEHYFVELMNHGIPAQHESMRHLLQLAKDLDVELLATNDSHYTDQNDAEGHDVLLCVQTGKKVTDTDRFRFDGDEAYYMKSPEQMWDLFPEVDFPRACSNTMKVAEMSNVEIPVGKEYLLPEFDLTDKEGLESITIQAKNAGTKVTTEVLREQVTDRAAEVYGTPIPEDVQDRIDHELTTIDNMGFPDYFLILSDIIRWSRSRGIGVGAGRGSAAGSLVAYLAEITAVDPLKYDLLFERFLNPHRTGMPDIDVDFDPFRVDEVIQYVMDTYGKDHVSLIATYGYLKVKSSIKDAARAKGYPVSVSNSLSQMIPSSDMTDWSGGLAGYVATVCPPHIKENDKQRGIWNGGKQLREEIASNPAYQDVIKTALQIEGSIRTTGEHAAGLLITPEPLWDQIPVRQKGKQTDTSLDLPVSEWDKDDSEAIGALKFDFLKILNLPVVQRTVDLIKEDTGEEIDVDALTFDDPAVYQMLASGESAGVFQLESAAATRMLVDVQVDGFHDLYNISAINRPGPLASGMDESYANRKRGTEKKTLIDPKLDAKMSPEVKEKLAPVLADSYNLMVMQEQIMLIAEIVAGYTTAEADSFRRVISKKKLKELEKMQPDFFAKGIARGNSEEFMQELWDILLPFSDYCFNKSHAVGYAFLSYHTAWLKRHYTAYFTAACVDFFPKDKVPVQIASARSLGVSVMAPDVNLSERLSTADQGTVYLGLGLVKGLGESAINSLVEIRKNGGKFTSLDDLAERVQGVISQGQVESLIKIGALSSISDSPSGLHSILDTVWAAARDKAAKSKKTASADYDDILGMFGDDDDTEGSVSGPVYFTPVPDLDIWDDKALNEFSKETVGFILGDHPCTELRKKGLPFGWVFPDEITKEHIGQSLKAVGMVDDVDNRISKNGKEFSLFTVDAGAGSLSGIFFGGTVPSGEIVVLTGRVEEDTFSGPDGFKLVTFSVGSESDIPTVSAQKNAVAKEQKTPRKRVRQSLSIKGVDSDVQGDSTPTPPRRRKKRKAAAVDVNTADHHGDTPEPAGGNSEHQEQGEKTTDTNTVVIKVVDTSSLLLIGPVLAPAVCAQGADVILLVGDTRITAPFLIDPDVVDWDQLSQYIEVVR